MNFTDIVFLSHDTCNNVLEQTIQHFIPEHSWEQLRRPKIHRIQSNFYEKP